MSRQISGRSRASTTGSGGFSYTNQTTTISTVDPSGNMTHVHSSYTHLNGGRSSARPPLRSIREDDDDDSDEDSCDEELGRFSGLSIENPRIMEITDAHFNQSMSRSSSGSRTLSSRPSESHRSSSSSRTITDSRVPSSRRITSRPADSHYSSSRPSESHRSSSSRTITDSRVPSSRLITSRPAESHYGSSRADSRRPTESSRYSSSESRRPTIRAASSRPAESQYSSSSRHSESRTGGGRPGRELVVYEEPRSTDQGKTRSSRRDTGSKMSAMSGLKDMVKRF